tara:strand:- start:562 stop:804 length:243 start_codon:yes stop_codon:yes gene_type:complete
MITMKPESRELLTKARAALKALGLNDSSFSGLVRAEMCEEQSEYCDGDIDWESIVSENASDSYNYVVDEFRDAHEHLEGV